MGKNIVVLSDGTGQDGGRGHDTNVYKLFRMLEDRTPNQIVFYDQGLGTDWKKITGSAFGAGFSKNLLQCYRFIYDNYEAGDRLFLFGFSRGAATVRSLANFIHYFGILPKARPELIKRAYRLYKAGRQERPSEVQEEIQGNALARVANKGFELLDRTTERIDSVLRESLNDKAKKFVREHPNQWASIDFLGVWDTVPALGLVPLAGLNFLMDKIPWWRHRFHDFTLHKSVKYAYQALSIDDDRLWFHPTVWKECGESQIVEQVWFSGSHTDVGGGFPAAGLSDTSLEWMVGKAVNHGVRLFLGSRKYWNFVIAPDSADKEHPPRAGAGKIYKYGSRDSVWDSKAFLSYGPPKVHESVLERAKKNAEYQPWILNNYPGYLRKLPARYKESLVDEHKNSYEKLLNEYLEIRSNPEDKRPLPDLPEDYEAWLEENPFYGWLQEKLPSYFEIIHTNPEPEELFQWLNAYKPYQTWLKNTYSEFRDSGMNGEVMIEPQNHLFSYEKEDGETIYLGTDLGKKECKEQGLKNKKQVVFRDYDREGLKRLIAKGLDTSDRGDYDNLLDRVILPKAIQAEGGPFKDRSKYDRTRWGYATDEKDEKE